MNDMDNFDIWWETLSPEAKDAVDMALRAGSSVVQQKKKILESAIQLIRDIRHGNIYNSPADEAQKWLVNNGIEKL